MINAYQEAISSARRAGAVQENRLHGWAAIKAGTDTALINFFYVEGGQVNAEVVWRGLIRRTPWIWLRITSIAKQGLASNSYKC